ncbi:hypothetical protein MKX08_008186 [Trichoderma sp. CBMAI-0020]|nr:hypothetical protein MKX08_008186 [Trichoderma sp. CBMAI-0020]WOD46345.1 hypothetical protein [Trichoderma atroviride]
MPSASTCTMGNACNSASNPTTPAASNSDFQRVRLHYASNINRFLADQVQTPPVGLGPVQTEDEAVAAGEARAATNLHAFHMQVEGGNKSPEAKSACKQK